MTKFTLEIELEDNKTCEGCPCFPEDASFCNVLRQYIKSTLKVTIHGSSYTYHRPKNCPLREICPERSSTEDLFEEMSFQDWG